MTLTILAVLSAFLFIVFYGRIIITAFRHHTITGLISFIPGLNLIILPSIWDKIGRTFIMSGISLGIAIASFQMGGYSHLKQSNLLSNQKITKMEETQTTEEEKRSTPEPISDNLKEIRLPKKPLHFLVFVDTSKEKYNELSNNDLRITLADNSIIEGRAAETTRESISIEKYDQEQEEGTSRIQKIKIANIKQLQTLSIHPIELE